MSRVVVVTGGTAGLGRAVARGFAHRGDKVAVLARGENRLRQTEAELNESGPGGLALMVDVADADAVEAAAGRIESELGPIDVWVNNAMTSVFAKVRDLTPEEVKRVTEVCYLGAVNGTLCALRRMLARDQGVIIQVGSALAYRAIPAQAAYCGAKHALRGFTDSLRTELLADRSGVKVTSVHLPAMNTPQFDWVRNKLGRRAQPVPPIFQPEVAADAIVAVADDPSREVWVGGPTWATVLGNKLIPGLLDRYLGAKGIGSQLTQEPLDPTRPDNLFAPVEGDYAAHGRFDEDAKPSSFTERVLTPLRSLSLRR
jgi:NAD(P)-dependent dehydrogenase (short-subunit alcohol dehydrogenase family)